MNQDQVAAAADLSISQISRLENAERDAKLPELRKIAALFKISVAELIGEAKGGLHIPVGGLIGAGAAVEMIGDPPERDLPTEVVLPGSGRVAAFIVRGDSQRPRFLDGEIVLYDPQPVLPAELIGQTAIVQTIDGRRLIKTLWRGVGEGRYRLYSHNADPEDDIALMGAWRYLGVLPPTERTLSKSPEIAVAAAASSTHRGRPARTVSQGKATKTRKQI